MEPGSPLRVSLILLFVVDVPMVLAMTEMNTSFPEPTKQGNVLSGTLQNSTTSTTAAAKQLLSNQEEYFLLVVRPTTYKVCFYTIVTVASIGLFFNFLSSVVFIKSRMVFSPVGEWIVVVLIEKSRFIKC